MRIFDSLGVSYSVTHKDYAATEMRKRVLQDKEYNVL